MESVSIRNSFLDFYKFKHHNEIQGSSLVPRDDDSLLFVNSGMVQFKNVFKGKENAPCLRVVTIQKCLRVGGKHNDLETVGFSLRHHTFFEMLGSFSFGDYFKAESCIYSLNFLKEIGLDIQNVYITVFEGNKKFSIDFESEQIWIKLGFSPERIRRKGFNENFWMIGDCGVCGPCTEIHYDTGSELLELWNLVFMEYEILSNEEIVRLPLSGVDTGMGLERICSVINKVTGAYETDLFKEAIRYCEIVSKKKYLNTLEYSDSIIRILVDHGRAIVCLIAEGIFPDNEGRGYILRRLIRRSIQYGLQLGGNNFCLFSICNKIFQIYEAVYPVIKGTEFLLRKIVECEERSFRKTLEIGVRMFDSIILEMGETKVLDGRVVYKMYDTHGFPPDFIKILAAQKGKEIDWEGFNLEKKKMLNVGDSGMGLTQDLDKLNGLYHKFGDTEYCDVLEMDIKVEGIYQRYLFFKQTPFYAESGGQEGDSGALYLGEEKINVLTTKKIYGLSAHLVDRIPSQLLEGVYLKACVDRDKRKGLSRNHTATHLLQSALKSVLGEYVIQKGSSISSSRLRFDFSSFESLTVEQVIRIESLMSQWILEKHSIEIVNLPLDKAKKEGYLTLLDEKYSREVRGVKIGNISKELCGGSHVQHTGEIVCFRIENQKPVSFGIRRIEAVTAQEALDITNKEKKIMKNLIHTLNVSLSEVEEKVRNLIEESKRIKKQMLKIKIQKAKDEISLAQSQIIIKDNLSILIKMVKVLLLEDKGIYIGELKRYSHEGVIIFAFYTLREEWNIVCISTKGAVNKVKMNDFFSSLKRENIKIYGLNFKSHIEIFGQGIVVLNSLFDDIYRFLEIKRA
ncbi:MAG: alanine--tRNA ligase [Deltaproteobacteria bacterium]|nr:MAG: alanine--tRNA ligase [Deltaproteobacteria bacterium]